MTFKIRTAWFWPSWGLPPFHRHCGGESLAEHFHRPRCCFPRWCAEGRLSHGRDNQILPSATRHPRALRVPPSISCNNSAYFSPPFSLPLRPISVSPPYSVFAAAAAAAPNLSTHSLAQKLRRVPRCLPPHVAALSSLERRREKKLPFPRRSGSSQPPVIALSCYSLPRMLTLTTDTAVRHSQSRGFFSEGPYQSSVCHVAHSSAVLPVFQSWCMGFS